MSTSEDAAPNTTVDLVERIRTSTRDLAATRQRMEAWLGPHLPGAAVSELDSPSANGLSSETLLFEASWADGDVELSQGFAARVAPDPANMPVFPSYDLGAQFRILGTLGELGTVPVPRVRWFEPEPAALGAPFFVMDRVEGRIPPDVMPYNFGSWLSEASPEDGAQLQRRSVEVLADIHKTPPEHLGFLAPDGVVPDAATALRAHVDGQRAYYAWVTEGTPSPLLEQCFAWLEDHWPQPDGRAVLSWGDARIGNMIFDGFEPVAVLDWEMMSLGPREIDVAWFIFLHRFFEDIAAAAGLPGMPDFHRRDEVAVQYQEASGQPLRDLDFYLMYAALRHGIVMSRTQRRAVHFGERDMPDDPDDLVFHRTTLEEMLAGTYWERVDALTA